MKITNKQIYISLFTVIFLYAVLILSTLDRRFHQSVESGSTAFAKLYLWLGANINSLHKGKPIIIGVLDSKTTYDRNKFIEYLIQKGANVDLADADGKTPLMYATRERRVKLFIKLLKAKANPNQLDQQGMTAAMHVFANKAGDYQRKILRRNCTMYKRLYRSCKRSLKEHYENEESRVAFARQSDFQMINSLVDNGSNLSIQDQAGHSVLMLAIKSGHIKGAHYLIKYSQINQTDHRGATALYYAVKKHQMLLIAALLENGADPTIKKTKLKSALERVNSYSPNTILYQVFHAHYRKSWSQEHFLAYQNHAFQKYQPYNIHVKTQDSVGLKPHDIAMLKKNWIAYASLIRLGAITNKKELLNRYVEFKELLKKKVIEKKYANIRDREYEIKFSDSEKKILLNVIQSIESKLDDWSPLMEIIADGNYEFDQQHSKNLINGRSFFNRTPLMIAAIFGNTKAVQKLLATKANVQAKDAWGWTALMYAVSRREKQIVELLLNHGARVHAKNHDCGTVMGIVNRQTVSTYAMTRINAGFTGRAKKDLPEFSNIMEKDQIRAMLENVWDDQKSKENCTKKVKNIYKGLEIYSSKNIFIK